MTTAAPVNTAARLFVGVPIPKKAKAVIKEAAQHYPKKNLQLVPEENWHLTLVWLGEVTDPQQHLTKFHPTLGQAYVLTVSITHLGIGRHEQQLWAYVNPTYALASLRQQLVEHLRAHGFSWKDDAREFVPHIRVANLVGSPSNIALADCAANFTFPVGASHLYASKLEEGRPHYSTLTKIYFTP